MEQRDLFDFCEPLAKKLSHRSDPVTSHDAAAEAIANGTIAKDEKRAVELVEANPGLTGYELDAIAGCGNRQISKRLGGLKNKSVLTQGVPRTCRIGGNRCVTWYLKGKLNEQAITT